MPRARNIKPGFFENEHLGVLNSDARLLFAALWTLADKQGVVECRIPRIRTYAFRYRNDITDDIVHRELTVLTRLDNGDMLSKVHYEGSDYLLIHNFVKHASPHHTEKRGDYPDFALLKSLVNKDAQEITVNSRKHHGENPPESLILNPDLLNPDLLNPSKENVPAVQIYRFDDFWNCYGYKIGKDKSKKAYDRAIRSGVKHEVIIQGIKNYQKDCQTKGLEVKFFKHPATWLNGKSWEDEYLEGTASLSKEDEADRIKRIIEESKKCKSTNLLLT